MRTFTEFQNTAGTPQQFAGQAAATATQARNVQALEAAIRNFNDPGLQQALMQTLQKYQMQQGQRPQQVQPTQQTQQTQQAQQVQQTQAPGMPQIAQQSQSG